MKGYRQQIGEWGEKLAEEYLISKGYQLLDRNYRTPYGEIDIIACMVGVVIFVEVKTRSTTTFGLPEGGVTLKKQAHLVDSARYYIQEHPELINSWRVDVIAIQGKLGGKSIKITHFENAIH